MRSTLAVFSRCDFKVFYRALDITLPLTFGFRLAWLVRHVFKAQTKAESKKVRFQKKWDVYIYIAIAPAFREEEDMTNLYTLRSENETKTKNAKPAMLRIERQDMHSFDAIYQHILCIQRPGKVRKCLQGKPETVNDEEKSGNTSKPRQTRDSE